MDIKDRIRLDKIEYYNMALNYFEFILEALMHCYIDTKEIKELVNHLKEYKEEISGEMFYLQYILKNIDTIDEDALDRVLVMIDDLNRRTYEYYEELGGRYADKVYPFVPIYHLDRRDPLMNVNYQLMEEVKGLTLTERDIANYFNHCTPYLYMKDHTKKFNTEDTVPFGIYTDTINGKISAIKAVVPPIRDLKSALINVHEYKHGIDLYPYIGSVYPTDIDFETPAKHEEEVFRKEYVRNK